MRSPSAKLGLCIYGHVRIVGEDCRECARLRQLRANRAQGRKEFVPQPGCPKHLDRRKINTCVDCRRIYARELARKHRGERTHCKNRHKYTLETTIDRTVYCKDGSSRVIKVCKLCVGGPKKPLPEFCYKRGHRLLLPDGTPTDNVWIGTTHGGKYKTWACNACERLDEHLAHQQDVNFALLSTSLVLDDLLAQASDAEVSTKRSCARRMHPAYQMEDWAEDYKREKATGRGFTRRLADHWGVDQWETERRMCSLSDRHFIDRQEPIEQWHMTRETCLNAGWGYIDAIEEVPTSSQWEVLQATPCMGMVYKFWPTWFDFVTEVEATWVPDVW